MRSQAQALPTTREPRIYFRVRFQEWDIDNGRQLASLQRSLLLDARAPRKEFIREVTELRKRQRHAKLHPQDDAKGEFDLKDWTAPFKLIRVQGPEEDHQGREWNH